LFERIFLTPRGEMMTLPQRDWSEGLGIGAAYGLIRPALGDISRLRAGVVLSLGAMAGSNFPATVLKEGEPDEAGETTARNVLDGVWFGAPLHSALTDVPLGSWT
jgi:hypothetical protein